MLGIRAPAVGAIAGGPQRGRDAAAGGAVAAVGVGLPPPLLHAQRGDVHRLARADDGRAGDHPGLPPALEEIPFDEHHRLAAGVDSGQGINPPAIALLPDVQAVQVPLQSAGGATIGPDRKERQGPVPGALAHMKRGDTRGFVAAHPTRQIACIKVVHAESIA